MKIKIKFKNHHVTKNKKIAVISLRKLLPSYHFFICLILFCMCLNLTNNNMELPKNRVKEGTKKLNFKLGKNAIIPMNNAINIVCHLYTEIL